jgi:hypothetical protein
MTPPAPITSLTPNELLKPIADTIPNELRRRGQSLLWCSEMDGSRPSKRPHLIVGHRSQSYDGTRYMFAAESCAK